MKKVYIVQASSGSYEDARWWIHSIWETPEEAEQSKAKLLSLIQETREIPNPIPQVDGEDVDIMDMSDAEYAKYDKWTTEKYEAEEFNGAEVKEYKIGIIIKNDH